MVCCLFFCDAVTWSLAANVYVLFNGTSVEELSVWFGPLTGCPADNRGGHALLALRELVPLAHYAGEIIHSRHRYPIVHKKYYTE